MKKVLILILVLFVPIFFLDFYTDAQVYSYIGRLIVEGGVPYVDAWDHKGISLYFINALGYGLLGFKSFVGIRILELLLIILSFTRFFKFARRNFTLESAFIASVFGLFTLKYFFDAGNMTEEYGAIFSLLSVLLLMKKHPKMLDFAIVGAFFIINFTIRANLIGLWVAIFLVYVVRLILKKDAIKTILLNFLKMGVGALAVVVLLGVYLWSTDSYQEFIDAAFTFNFSYTEGSSFTGILSTMTKSMIRYRLSVLIAVAWLLSLIRFYKDKNRFLELLLLFWIPIELYFSNMSDRMYAHYYLMWMPLVMLSILIILSEVRKKFAVSQVKLMIGSFLVFAVLYYVPTYMTFKDWKTIVQGKHRTERHDAGLYISENYKDDTLLIWGNDCDLYNYSQKSSPITFFYQSTFKYDTKLIREKITDFNEQLIEKKPTLIIDAKRNGLLQLDMSNTDKVSREQVRNLQSFIGFVSANYALKEQKFGLDFYVLKDE